MKFYNVIVLVLFSLSISLIGNAQSKKIVIVDEEKEPVAGATATIISLPDSTLVFAAISDEKGTVAVPATIASPAELKVSCIGFDNSVIPYDKSISGITLLKSTTELGEVVVKIPPASLKPMVGKYIFEPGVLKTMTANGYDLLSQTPLIEVSNGSASIFGVGNSMIFINGRAPNMSPMELRQMLTSLPTDRIKRIEIITEPGSTYSTSFSGGIVNIILDNPLEGFRGSMGLDAAYHRTQFSPSISFYGNYAIDKLRVSAGLNYTTQYSREKSTTVYDYTDMDRYVRNISDSRNRFNSVGGSLHATYDFNPNSTFGIGASISDSHSWDRSLIESHETENGATSIDQSKIESDTPWGRPNWGVYAFYTLMLDDKGSYLDISSNYSSRKSTGTTTYFFDFDPEVQSTEVSGYGMNFKPKFSYVINDRHQLTAGYEFIKSKVDNDYRFAPNDNRFIYQDMFNSGYAEWEARWSNVVSSRLGLRLENSDISGEQQVKSQSFKQNYTDLFPSINITLRLPGPGKQSLSFNGRRSIMRPFYSNLNPFVFWTSETTCSKGNEYLQPTYYWSANCNYSFLSSFIFSVGFDHYSDLKSDYIFREGDITVSSTANIGQMNVINSSLYFYKTFSNVASIRSTISFKHEDTKGMLNNQLMDYVDNRGSFSVNGAWYFPKPKIRINLGYSLYSPSRLVTRWSKWRNNLNIEVTKWFNNQMMLKLTMADLLNAYPAYHYSSANYAYRQHYDLYNGSVLLTFAYSFGKQKIRSADDREDSDLNRRFQR